MASAAWWTSLFVGVGENGHLAFNDPPADFETEEPYLIVNLDEALPPATGRRSLVRRYITGAQAGNLDVGPADPEGEGDSGGRARSRERRRP